MATGVAYAGAASCLLGLICTENYLNRGEFKNPDPKSPVTVCLDYSKKGWKEFITGEEIYDERRILTENEEKKNETNSDLLLKKIAIFMSTVSEGLMEMMVGAGQGNRDEKIEEFKAKFDSIVGRLPGIENKFLVEEFKGVVFEGFDMQRVEEIDGDISQYVGSHDFRRVFRIGVMMWLTLARSKMADLMKDNENAKAVFESEISNITDEINGLGTRKMILI